MSTLPEPTQLDGTWTAAASTDELRRSFAEPEVPDGDDWHDVEVPGHWQLHEPFTDLDGPLLHRHRWHTGEGPSAALSRLRPGRRAWLRLGGVFYTSEVWLDGDLLGDTDGYFMAHVFEITEQVEHRAEHLLAIEVACAPVRDLRNKRQLTGVYQHSDTLDDTRNPGGLWRPVEVLSTGPVRIQRHRVLCTEASAGRAVLQVQLTLDSLLPRTVRLRSTLGGLDQEQDASLAAGETTHEWRIVVEDPQLWWPHALGAPTLHRLGIEVHLTHDDPERASVEMSGGCSDRVEMSTGLRTVDRDGWTFQINGERLFLKGANQPPLRRFPAEETPELAKRVVDAAPAAELDLLRFWGHVPTPEVLDACDRAGLLTWVDMPLQWGYHRSVKQSAIAQARGLIDLHGHRPSIVIWCAHNEPFSLKGQASVPHLPGRVLHGIRLAGAHQLPSWNRSVLDPAIGAALRSGDPTRVVEDHSGVLPHLPTLSGGDTHIFAGWRFGNADTLARLLRMLPRLGRFVSAFGAPSRPEDPGRAGRPDPTRDRQARLVRRQVGDLRRLKYRPAGGFSVHFLADAEPGDGCSLVDLDGEPKAAFDALAAACSPVLAVVDPLPERPRPGQRVALRVHLVNDLRHAASGVVTAELRWPSGGVRRRWSGTAGADQVARVGVLRARLPAAIPPAGGGARAEPVLRLSVTFEGEGLHSVWVDSA